MCRVRGGEEAPGATLVSGPATLGHLFPDRAHGATSARCCRSTPGAEGRTAPALVCRRPFRYSFLLQIS